MYTPECHNVRFSVATMATAGLALARSLETKYAERTSNKDIFIRNFSDSQDEILASLEKATGKQWTKQWTKQLT